MNTHGVVIVRYISYFTVMQQQVFVTKQEESLESNVHGSRILLIHTPVNTHLYLNSIDT